jgi:two-component system sensor histidine kinase UhpB
MAERLRLLLLEDDEIDAEVELAAIRAGGIDCEPRRVHTRTAFEAALTEGGWDLVLADYNLPAFTGVEALQLVRSRDTSLPFILISGTLGEERAIESLKAGANDYLLKDNLARLAPAIRRAREEYEVRRKHQETQRALEESEQRYRGIVEDQTELVVRCSPEGVLEFANQAFGRCFGRLVSELTGRPLIGFVMEEDREQVSRALAGLSIDAPIAECECRARSHEGGVEATVWQNWTFRGLFDPGGRLSQVQAVGRDVTERMSMMLELKHMQQRLRQLSWRFLGTIEAERRALSRELHDEIGQILTGIRFNLEALARQSADPGAQARIRECIDSAQLVLQQVRKVSHNLRPVQLDDLGLVAALRLHLDRQAGLGGFQPHFKSFQLDARLAPEVETTCFRIAQEALTNVLRHAQARNVWVELSMDGSGHMLLRVKDDGRGFDPATEAARHEGSGSLGLLGMEERVALLHGSIEISSRPGKGTEILARIPLSESAAGEPMPPLGAEPALKAEH